MEPQAPSITSSLDPQAVNLAKAIRQTETGGNFTAQGKSGEYGAYQFTEPTWNKLSSEYGVNVPLKSATPEQQNEVAYKQIKAWKDQGYNVGQIASLWNSGKPDAYTDPNYKGTNKYGVQYDVPAYAKSVATAYQELKKGGQVGVDSKNPSSTAAPQTPAPNGTPKNNDFLDTVTNALTSVFPGTKQAGEGIGTAIYNIGQLAEGKNPFEGPNAAASKVNVPTTAGGFLSAGAQAATAGIGGPGSTAIGRIGSLSGLGAIGGAGNALASGATTASGVGSGAAVGGFLGGALGGIGEGIAALPRRIVSSYLTKASPETVEYALKKGVGNPTSMLNKSTTNLAKVGNTIDGVLSHPEVSNKIITAPEVFTPIKARFLDANLNDAEIATYLNNHAPMAKGLLDKLLKQGLNPAELNRLKTAVGKDTFKNVLDEPTVKAGKDVGNAAYHAIDEWLQKEVPAAKPLFTEYSSERNLNNALKYLQRSGAKKKVVSLYDLITLMGTASAGLPGMLGGVALEKAATNPTVNLGAAGLLNNISRLGPVAHMATTPAASQVGGLLGTTQK